MSKTIPKFTAEITKLPDPSLAYSNNIYTSAQQYYKWKKDLPSAFNDKEVYIIITSQGKRAPNMQPYTLKTQNGIDSDMIAMSEIQRRQMSVALNDVVNVEFMSEEAVVDIGLIKFHVEFKVKSERMEKLVIDVNDLMNKFLKDFERQAFYLQEKTIYKFGGVTYIFTCCSMIGVNSDITLDFGKLMDTTMIEFESIDKNIVLEGGTKEDDEGRAPVIIIPWEELGIGGLQDEYLEIYRRAFATRNLSAKTVKQFNIKHSKGILLYGPPGTGKTLIARRIGQLLTGKEPKKISGSDILSKWVGEAEKKIRELFVEAEIEYAEKGEKSGLHVIIIDELDSICRARGSSHTHGDTIVNQLLAKMDGVDEINNILLIGMTNRRDLIDQALLRPGRFGIQIEIHLPDEDGRKEILDIHTQKIREHKRMDINIDLKHYARITKNYSGAELADLVHNARTHAIARHIDFTSTEKKKIDEDNIIITKEDFDRSYQEVKPAFGINEKDLSELIASPYVTYSSHLGDIQMEIIKDMKLLLGSTVLNNYSILITGKSQSGKSSLVSKLGFDSNYTHVKIINADQFIGRGEMESASKLNDIFRDVYKSEHSLVIIDDIERIISYSPVGPRFFNSVVQALMVLISKKVKGKKIFVLATTSDMEAIELLGLSKVFNKKFEMPMIDDKSIGDMVVEIEEKRTTFNDSDFNQYLNNLGDQWLPFNKKEN
jgi:vesicle-fusing ATPase